MPLGPTDVFWIGIVPCLVAAIAFVALRRLRPSAVWSLSIAAGLVVGMIARNARSDSHVALAKLLHPQAAIDWLPWLVLVAAAIGALAAYAPRNWQRWLVALAGAFALVVPWRLLATNAAAMTRWTVTEKLAILAFWFVAFALAWLTVALGRLNGRPLLRGTLLTVVALGIAITLAASGAITLGELGGIAAASLIGVLVVAWRFGPIAEGPSHAAGPLIVMLLGLILIGYSYDLSATNATLLAASLFAAAGWLPRLPLAVGEGRGEGVSRSNWGEISLRVALSIVPLALAIASAISTALAETYG